MIITKAKKGKDIEKYISNYKRIFLIGCSECATLCGTGDDEAISLMKNWLESIGKEITGSFIAKTGCQILGQKENSHNIRKHWKELIAFLFSPVAQGPKQLQNYIQKSL